MLFKTFKFLPFLMFLNSCSFLFNDGYKGLATTTLAGHIVFSETSCYIAAVNQTSNPDEAIFNIVINLVTVGDKYVTACVIEDNYADMWEGHVPPITKPNWFDENSGIAFYASDSADAGPGSNSVGDASEILLYGETNTGYTSIFPFNSFNIGLPDCSSIDSSFTGFKYADLDLTVLHKKPYIVARVPLCGNLAIGTASNPLYSEKNHMDK